MTDAVIQVLTSFAGTLGFGFLFNVRGKKLLFASLGGALAWLLFLVLGNWMDSEPLRYLLVSVCKPTPGDSEAAHCPSNFPRPEKGATPRHRPEKQKAVSFP